MVAEGALVAAALSGSDAAFRGIVAEHQAGLRAFLGRLCADAAEADDLAQETFVTAWRQLDRYRPGVKVRVWLCGIAWRKASSHRRRLFRSRVRDGAWQASRPTGFAETHDERLSVQAAMAALAPEVRACIALCLAADWSHAEAAEALTLPLGTVKSHLGRGRAALLKVLEPSHDR